MVAITVDTLLLFEFLGAETSASLYTKIHAAITSDGWNPYVIVILVVLICRVVKLALQIYDSRYLLRLKLRFAQDHPHISYNAELFLGLATSGAVISLFSYIGLTTHTITSQLGLSAGVSFGSFLVDRFQAMFEAWQAWIMADGTERRQHGFYGVLNALACMGICGLGIYAVTVPMVQVMPQSSGYCEEYAIDLVPGPHQAFAYNTSASPKVAIPDFRTEFDTSKYYFVKDYSRNNCTIVIPVNVSAISVHQGAIVQHEKDVFLKGSMTVAAVEAEIYVGLQLPFQRYPTTLTSNNDLILDCGLDVSGQGGGNYQRYLCNSPKSSQNFDINIAIQVGFCGYYSKLSSEEFSCDNITNVTVPVILLD